MTKALFLDRDGVLNKDTGYVCSVEKTIFLEENILRFSKFKEFVPIIITNQSGIGRNYFSKQNFLIYMNWFIKELSDRNLEIKKFYFCPHLPSEKCDCRKPLPGLFLQAKDEFSLDIKNSWMFGDKTSDMEAAKAAGIRNCELI